MVVGGNGPLSSEINVALRYVCLFIGFSVDTWAGEAIRQKTIQILRILYVS
jgi:hypothetical protein